jgi:hypothetical protein
VMKIKWVERYSHGFFICCRKIRKKYVYMTLLLSEIFKKTDKIVDLSGMAFCGLR